MKTATDIMAEYSRKLQKEFPAVNCHYQTDSKKAELYFLDRAWNRVLEISLPHDAPADVARKMCLAALDYASGLQTAADIAVREAETESGEEVEA